MLENFSMNKSLSTLILAVSVLLMTACAGVKPVQTTEAPPPVESEPVLPLVELSSDILYDLLVAEIAGHRGHYDLSVTTLVRLAQQTRDPRLAERATLAALYSKRYVEAAEAARLWVELQPDSSEARESLASVLMEIDKPVEAQLHFEKILAIANDNNNLNLAFLRVASLLGRQSNRTSALELMRTLVAKYPQNPSAHFGLSHLSVRVDELEDAIHAVDQALSLRPDWEEAALFRARILISQRDAQAAQSYYEEYLTSFPRSSMMRINYARYLVDLKQWEKARAQFKQVIKNNPNNADGTYAVGLLSLQTNKLEDAEKYLRLALKLKPNNHQALIYLGQVAEQRKRYVDAEKWYRKIPSGEYYFEAQMRHAIVIAKQGNLAGARKHLHNTTPNNNQQRVEMSLAEEQMLREAKDYQEALNVLNNALTKLPEHIDLLYARALIAEKLDDLDLHERDLRVIMKRDPGNAHALNALGYTLADRTDRYKEALELIERALALKPDDPFILDSLGWVHYRMGNTAEAISFLKQALNLRNDAEISAHLGEVLWVTGDKYEAKSVWRRALKLTPDNDVLQDVLKKFEQ